ncbi:MAG: alpha/beta hydrolase [Acetatifactor sp.]|nr:alpha/beta hydrolase [Acetatifactor sp.]
MKTEVYKIQVDGSQPEAKLCTYIQDSADILMIKERPFILICPGGGYTSVSIREGEPLAVRFLAMGYHVAVLRYSCTPAVYPAALLELASAVKLIHAHSEEWKVRTDKIFVLGCSAGGHLAASLGVFWHEPWLAEKTGVKNEILKPAGMILCYPAINMLEHWSQTILVGQDTEEMRERVSLEKQVTEHTPEAFIWHTYSDTVVPVENSLVLIAAMRKYQIPVEFHMYPQGVHGLAAADELTQHADGSKIQKECSSWLGLVQTWLRERT